MKWILIIAATLSILALWLLPRLQVRNLPIEPKDRFLSENEARKTVAQIFSGLFFFGTLYFTWQSYEISRQQALGARFAKAIEQFADPKEEIRLGAIYSLETISGDSPEHYWQTMEVLTAYVRRKVPWTAQDFTREPDEQCLHQRPDIPPNAIAGACICDAKYNATLEWSQGSQAIAPDIQAILSVLGRRRLEYEKPWQRLDLRNTDLRSADLKEFHLERAVFANANLSGADFRGAFLLEADLSGAVAYEALFGDAHLDRARLNDLLGREANFYQANLPGADLSGACLDGAQFGEAVLVGAKLESSVTLRSAQMWDANMKGITTEFANLEGADLTRADLTGADLAGIYLLSCEQLKVAKSQSAKRQPSQPACK